ncbi:nucleocapsid protein [Bovine narmovirus 1]|nr:nucleocapsid protein [Bovine narmovirus 1]WFG82177.1 nucleocapsid protein [Bovine narmovirus 1]WFG82183.1 nucleocapsid protein [Bovine narmovirus 1]WFG82189.1 nucleocapsid protein [Bovine narmovirus 1]
MAGVLGTLRLFREHKNQSLKSGTLTTTLSGIKAKVVVLVPVSSNPKLRWELTKLLLLMASSEEAPNQLITGAFLSLLALFSEIPGQLLRSLSNDPDIEMQIIEVSMTRENKIVFASRGKKLDKYLETYTKLAVGNRADSDNPFEDLQIDEVTDLSTDEYIMAISTITLQIWILLSKAVTAPDTARDSERKRWVKFLQQRRVDPTFRLTQAWLDRAREKIASDLSIRRFMVEILIEIKRSGPNKGRIAEAIGDIGSYIEETGLAGFFLTIKYGIETKYPALALNEFQGDLAVIEGLMRLYQELGPRAPYMVLLEDSAQVKFAPGNYPLLWSYAMGVGTALDRSMNNLNFNRDYLEPSYFRLGQSIVKTSEGTLDTVMSSELHISAEQADNLRRAISNAGVGGSEIQIQQRSGRFQPVEANLLGDEMEEDDPTEDIIVASKAPRTGPYMLQDQEPAPSRDKSGRPGRFRSQSSKKSITSEESPLLIDDLEQMETAFREAHSKVKTSSDQGLRPDSLSSGTDKQDTMNDLDLLDIELKGL